MPARARRVDRSPAGPGWGATSSRLIAVAAALLLGLGGALLPAGSASAAAFEITSHANDAFVSGNSVRVAGTGADGAEIRITGPRVAACATTVVGGGWSCDLVLPDGRTTLDVTHTPPASRPGAAGAALTAPALAPDPAPAPSRPAPPAPSPAPVPEPTPDPETRQLTLRALGAPSIDGSGTVLTTGIITGTAAPFAGIRVDARPVAGGAAQSFTCPAAIASGYWSCPLGSAIGEYEATAIQFSPSDPRESSPPSAPRRLIIDRDPPAAPVITSPAADSTVPTTNVPFRGRGETGGTVDVFASGALACSALVVDSGWACTAGEVRQGRHVVQAIQRDAAGNFSSPSAVIRIVFRAGSVSTPVEPTPGEPGASPAPGDPTAAPPIPGEPPADGDAAAPGSKGVLPGWGASSGFGSALPAMAKALGDPSSLGGALLALLFIALVALPLRLLTTTLRGREVVWRLPRLLGRNQPSPIVASIAETDPVRVRRLTLIGGALAVASVVAAIAVGLQGDIRDVRLVAAMVLALIAVNVLGIAVPGLLVARALGVPHRLRLVPTYLLVAVIAAVVSRMLGITPPVLIGVVLGVSLLAADRERTRHLAEPDARSRALVPLAQLTALGALALSAWVARDALGTGIGLGGALVQETLAGVCIAGFGSAVLLVLPVSSLPGQALFAWSPWAWLATAVPLVSLAAVALTAAVGFPVLVLIGAAVLVAVLSVGTWSWVRWIEPALAR